MPSSFTVRSASGYEQLMGRWSRQLAGPFSDFTGITKGERVLDVGCGTGSLTFALPQAAEIAEVEAIDFSPIFVEEARRRNSDPRITIREGDACAIPFPDGGFDRALSLLVLHFVPAADKAVAEMRRVVRPGGVVQGRIRIDPSNHHTCLYPRIGIVNHEGQFTLVRQAMRAVHPDPYLVTHSLGDWTMRLGALE